MDSCHVCKSINSKHTVARSTDELNHQAKPVPVVLVPTATQHKQSSQDDLLKDE